MKSMALAALVLLTASCSEEESFTDAAPPDDSSGVDANTDLVDAEPGPDLTPPGTTITDAPADPSDQALATFAFEADEPATFVCRVDDAAFATCTSPHDATVADGAHTFEVRATDLAGNEETDPATHAWVVDTDPPETTITSAPPVLDNSVDVSFGLASDEVGSFECRLDDGPFAACTSPHPVTGLTDDPHTFEVRAIDLAGNVDASPASHAWTTDSSTPDTVIDTGPTGPVNVTGATFTFSSPDAGVGATFECRLDDAVFTSCVSPRVYTGLAAGEHTFRVRVLDGVGNPDPSPATQVWTIDVTAPNTTIDTGPTGPTPSTSASFTFSSGEAATFECQLDSDPYAACTTPRNLSGLAQGGHVFRVRATDLAGNVDPTPDSRSWTVDTVPPDTTVAGPPSPSNVTGPQLTFSSTEAGSTFECALDGGAYATCTSPRTLSGLSSMSHTFLVRATDAAGLTDATPASHTWTVDAVAPTVASITTTTADGRYGAGTIVTIVITFTEVVTVTGSPSLLLETGTTDRSATLTGGAGTTTLTFQYTVQTGDSTADLDYASTGALTGGTIADAATNAATRTLPAPGAAGSIAATHAVVIAAAAPVMTAVTVTPTTAYTNTTLTCNPSATDPDGDTVTFTYAWTVDGASVAGTTNQLAGTSFAEDQLVRCIATPTGGGTIGAAMTSSPVTILNSTPVMATVSLTPTTAYTNSTMTCTATATDADAETVNFTYQWYRSGVLQAATGTTLSAPAAFDKGHELQCRATPNDGTATGTQMSSNSVTILNSVPVVSGISVTPSPATTNSELTCAPTTSDADNDTVTPSYEWLVNGSVVATGASLNGALAGTFGYGDQVRCRVTPNDGTVSGAAVTSSILTISNTAPVMSSVSVSPTTAYTNDTLTCTASASDADGHGVNLTYEWRRAGSTIGTGPTLLGSEFSRGEQITCRVTPTDTINNGGSMSSSPLTISNTAPTMVSVSVTPSPARSVNPLTCYRVGSDVDGDFLEYTYVWYVNDVPAGSAQTLGAQQRGTKVSCTATPFDGSVSGSGMSSGDVFIANSPPPPPSPVTISPFNPNPTSRLTCGYTPVVDPDGDTPVYTFEWRKFGSTIPGATGSTLAALGNLTTGDVIECITWASDGADVSGDISPRVTIGDPPQCSPIGGLTCNAQVPLSGETQSGTDVIDQYSCSSWFETGPEVGHGWIAPFSGQVTATLTSQQGVDLDVFVIEDTGGQGCAPTNCISFGNDSATWNAVAGTVYHIVVDGYEGAQGSYTLALSCPPQN